MEGVLTLTTVQDYESFVGKRVLVTGGAGFVGSNLASRLVDIGAHVVVLDNFSQDTRRT